MDSLYPWENGEKSYNELINFVDDRLGHDFRYAMDISKIKKELDWSPSYTFEDGLKRVIECVKSNQKIANDLCNSSKNSVNCPSY